MEYRTLGRTGLRVSEIGLGTSRTFSAAADTDEARCVRIVHEAIDSGVNFIDTAPVYGRAERVVGKSLADRRGKVFLATKVWQTDASSARASIERSFELLRTEVIDLLQIHNMVGWRAVIPVLQEYQQRGRVRFLGVTERRPENYPEVMEAMRTGVFDTVQVPCYLGETSCREAVLPLARELDLGVIVMRPFSRLVTRRRLLPARGFFKGLRAALARFGRKQLLGAGGERALAFLKDYDAATPGQGLLKYILADPAVSTVIPTTATPGRMRENAGASGGQPLPPEALARLEALLP